jgi:meso-butanediol dehydrogenase/(S,S)-butanediol dehydrogenase/diacetyl reductase
MTMNRFEDKVVIITGAASGIGRASAHIIAAEGGTIACVDINAAGLEKTVSDITAAGGEAAAYECNLAEPDSISAAVRAIVAAHGRIDALCNVAGILRADNTHELTLEAWNRVITINLTGTFLMVKACLPHLLEAKGNIVNMSSTAAMGGHPWMAAYAASKGAIESFTKVLACEYVKQGLNANFVIPGGIATPMHSQFRMPKGADPNLIRRIMPQVAYVGPEHVGRAVAFLASSDAHYMNGSEIRLDGGMMS